MDLLKNIKMIEGEKRGKRLGGGAKKKP